jgi:predicted secreted protein
MTITAGLAIYGVIWWIVLFAVLPLGVKPQIESDIMPGTDVGAPQAHQMWRKALITTLIAALVWMLIAWLIIYKPFSFDDLPFLPKLDGKY